MEGWIGLTVTAMMCLMAAILVIVLLPMFIPDSWALRYHAMHASYLVGAFCLTCIALMASKFTTSNRIIKFSRYASLLWAQLMGWDVRTWRRLDILVESKNAVVVVNHQSSFDVFPFLRVWQVLGPMMMAFVGSELKNYVLLGKGIQQVSSIHFLDRKKPREAMNTLISDTRDHFKQNEKNKIIIFAEGTRNLKIRERKWKFGEFKLGPFRTAKALNVPIIPVVLSPFYFLNQDECYFARGKTITSVMEPIHPGDETVDELKEKVKHMMQEEFFRLQSELLGGNERVTNETDSNQ